MQKAKIFVRTVHSDITTLVTATKQIVLSPGQVFYETPKAFEIWQTEPLFCIKRIPHKYVLWVIQK